MDSSTPNLAAYAAQRGLSHRDVSFALPKATQLMRHGFMQEVRSVAGGDLPGALPDGWLAQVDYVYVPDKDDGRSCFTLVLVEAATSVSYALRVLCHDRGLSKRDTSNPDADRQVIKLDDKGVHLESDRFLARYVLSTDHDQDPLRVWQLFGPGLIEWLTDEAPTGFSFELQDGALCCFVPGYTAEPGELDALCAAAAHVFARVTAIEVGDSDAGVDGSRDQIVERELAAHPFQAPPKSTKAAAKEFRHGLTLGDQAWALGAEAFFREHAAAVGFAPIAPGAFRAGHLTTFLPGILAQVAHGTVAGAGAHLVLTNDENYDDMGWSTLLVDLGSAMPLALAQGIPQRDASRRGEIRTGSDGRSLILTALDGGARDRKAEEFEAFFAAAGQRVAQLNGGGTVSV